MDESSWGTQSWQEDHFPQDQLDSTGDAWGIRWRGVEKWRHRLYVKAIRKSLRRERPVAVLDIGCALCDFTQKAWRLNRDNKFWGLDTSERAIAWNSQKFPMFEFKVATLPEIPFDTKFDVVFCLEVLCYLDSEGRRASIRNIHDSLTPGGVLMFSGVLDGGNRHHTKEEVLDLLAPDFEVQKIVYHHWWLHRGFEEILNRIDFAATSLAGKIKMPADEFRDWCAERSGGAQTALIKLLRIARPVSAWPLAWLSLLIKFLLGRESLAILGDGISKLFWSEDKAGEIVVLARKKQQKE